MYISQKNQINSLSQLLDIFEKEVNYGTPAGELTFLTGRIGELYTAIIKNGQLPLKTNQPGYDVETETQKISVKTTTSNRGSHHFSFNKNSLKEVSWVVILKIDTEEFEIKVLFDGPIEQAKALMIENKSNPNQYTLSQSKVSNKKNIVKSKREVPENSIIEEVTYKQWQVQRQRISPKIIVRSNGVKIPSGKVLYELRKLAVCIGVEVVKENGIRFTTNELGSKVINQLKSLENA